MACSNRKLKCTQYVYSELILLAKHTGLTNEMHRVNFHVPYPLGVKLAYIQERKLLGAIGTLSGPWTILPEPPV